MTVFVQKVWLFCLTLLLCSAWYLPKGADAADFSQAQLKLMSTFVSNFTELGLMNFDIKKGSSGKVRHLGGDPSNPELILFGIMHNYVNNFESRIKPCPTQGCVHGPRVIDAKYVVESVKKYFDINLKNPRVKQSDQPYYFDGKLYHFADTDGEFVYYAEVKQATQKGGIVRMTGDIYNADDKNDRPFTFVATAKPYKWNGKDTWAILSLRTTKR